MEEQYTRKMLTKTKVVQIYDKTKQVLRQKHEECRGSLNNDKPMKQEDIETLNSYVSNKIC